MPRTRWYLRVGHKYQPKYQPQLDSQGGVGYNRGRIQHHLDGSSPGVCMILAVSIGFQIRMRGACSGSVL